MYQKVLVEAIYWHKFQYQLNSDIANWQKTEMKSNVNLALKIIV